jgi:hypothetical protein
VLTDSELPKILDAGRPVSENEFTRQLYALKSYKALPQSSTPIGSAQSPYQAGRDGYPLTTYIAQAYTFSCIDLGIYVL